MTLISRKQAIFLKESSNLISFTYAFHQYNHNLKRLLFLSTYFDSRFFFAVTLSFADRPAPRSDCPTMFPSWRPVAGFSIVICPSSVATATCFPSGRNATQSPGIDHNSWLVKMCAYRQSTTDNDFYLSHHTNNKTWFPLKNLQL